MNEYEQLVEEAARALASVGEFPAFTGDFCDEWAEDMYRIHARAALASINIPGIWNEGYSAGLIDGIADEGGLAANPYEEAE